MASSLPSLVTAATKYSADAVLAVVAEVVLDDQRAVRPAAQDRPIEMKGVENRRNIVGPQPGVAVGVARLLRQTMPPHIHRDETMVTRQLGVQLPAPGQRALRKPVDEQNRPARRIAGLDDVQLHSSATCDFVCLHGVLHASQRKLRVTLNLPAEWTPAYHQN